MKPGYKTTEFWLTLLANTIGALLTSGLIADGSTLARVLGVIMMVLSTLGYNVSRGMAKGGEAKPPTSEGGFARVPMLLVIAMVGVMIACGASAREKALRTTFVAATTAQAGFVEWDKEHQLQIARDAPSKLIALAELTTYREKRAGVVDAFEAVYRAIAAAALLEQDHKSLASALGAFEQLRLALSLLTGGQVP